MGRTLVTITQLLTETEANLSAFRRTLRRSDQYIFDGLFAAARRHICLLYTSDAADERSSVDLGGRRIIKKKK